MLSFLGLTGGCSSTGHLCVFCIAIEGGQVTQGFIPKLYNIRINFLPLELTVSHEKAENSDGPFQFGQSVKQFCSEWPDVL